MPHAYCPYVFAIVMLNFILCAAVMYHRKGGKTAAGMCHRKGTNAAMHKGNI